MVALVALRIGIGLHFYNEGVDKMRDPQPYSAGFLLNAKGHFAPFYRELVWDPDGLARLDGPATLQIWDHYRQRAVKEYGLGDQAAKVAQRAFDRRRGQLQWWLDVNETEIREYRQALERRDRDWDDPDRMEVASLRGQVAKLEQELAAKRRELIGPIDQMWQGYGQDLQQLGPDPDGSVALRRPGRRLLDSESIDSVIRYFDVIVGAFLILGLFTRTASVLAALFLASVMVSQWPGAWGALPVWPQWVEMLGLLVLAATGAGRFAGLDFLVGSLRRWCCPPKQGTES